MYKIEIFVEKRTSELKLKVNNFLEVNSFSQAFKLEDIKYTATEVEGRISYSAMIIYR